MLDSCCWVLPICRDLEIFMMMYTDLMTCIFWRCMTYIRCDCGEILYMHVIWIWCEDVASISWIFILFVRIIALIEIGCYSTPFYLTNCYHSIMKYSTSRNSPSSILDTCSTFKAEYFHIHGAMYIPKRSLLPCVRSNNLPILSQLTTLGRQQCSIVGMIIGRRSLMWQNPIKIFAFLKGGHVW